MKSHHFVFLLLYLNTIILSNFQIPTDNLYLIEKAWSVNSAGPGVPKDNQSYYNMTVNDIFFQGLRPWELRWEMIKDATNYQGKRILELGCCMALVSTCLKKYCKVSKATGVDGTDAFLASQGSPDRIRAAQWVTQAFEVEVEFIQTDLNRDAYESIIGTEYDIVFCFSLLHWIHDKDRFMNYLAQFNEVIFEGHESAEFEIKRFQSYGFTNYTILGQADRGRTVIHFYK